jgi:hypothetical protein
MVLHPAPRQRVGDTESPTVFTQECALCDSRSSAGSLLLSQPGAAGRALWVCEDCQHKLARRIDDEGALGG